MVFNSFKMAVQFFKTASKFPFYFVSLLSSFFVQEVESPLLKYLQRSKDTVSFDFVQAFLRCGIDVTIKNKVTSHTKIFGLSFPTGRL